MSCRGRRLVEVLGAAVAPGGQQEQRSAQHRQHVADDGHPEAPAEVRAAEVGVVVVERLTEVLVVLARVRDGVVRVIGRTDAERHQCTGLYQSCAHKQQAIVLNSNTADSGLAAGQWVNNPGASRGSVPVTSGLPRISFLGV